MFFARNTPRLRLNESPELIAQEFGAVLAAPEYPAASMKVLSLLLRNCLVDVASRADRHASMKVLSLLLRNVEIIGILWVITRLNESPELIAQESQCSSTRPSYTAWPQ